MIKKRKRGTNKQLIVLLVVMAITLMAGCKKKSTDEETLTVAQYQTAIRESILNMSSYVNGESDGDDTDMLSGVNEELDKISNLAAPAQCKEYNNELKSICKEYSEIINYLSDISSKSEDELGEDADKYSEEIEKKSERLEELQGEFEDVLSDIFSVDTGETVSSKKES